MLNAHKEILDKTHAAMRFIAKKTNVRGKLRKHTPLAPVCRNVTRWTSTSNMMRRYLRLAPILEQFGVQIGGLALANLLLNAGEKAELEALAEEMKPFSSVMVFIQRENLTLSDVNDIFEELAASCSHEVRQYLTLYGSKVPFPSFSAGIVKVLQRKFADLTPDELRWIDSLKDCLGTTPAVPEAALQVNLTPYTLHNSYTLHLTQFLHKPYTNLTQTLLSRLKRIRT
jgi:hypothetical protein